MVCLSQTYECVLSTDLMDHVPNVADAGKPAVGKYLVTMMMVEKIGGSLLSRVFLRATAYML